MLIELEVLNYVFAKVMAHFLEMVGVEVQVLVFPKVSTTETCLESKGILNAKLFPAHNSSSAFFGSLYTECAVRVAKNLRLLLKHVWEHTFSMPGVAFKTVSVHKYVLLSRVAVKITKEKHSSFVLNTFDEPFDCE